MEITKIVQWIGGIIIVVLVLFLFKNAITIDTSSSPSSSVQGPTLNSMGQQQSSVNKQQQQQSVQSSAVLAKEVDGVQEVTLSWGKFNYDPEVIRVKAGKPVKIIGDVSRLQGCFQSLVIPELKLEKYFTKGDNVLLFTPEEKGTFGFTCAMGMGKGTLIVE